MPAPKKVLHWGLMHGLGGVETFVMNIYNHIDRDILQFDFLTQTGGKIIFENEIKELGGNIFPVVCPKKESIFEHKKSLNEFFSKHNDYVALHMHMNFIRYYAPLVYAKKYGIAKRIYHSHNSSDMRPNNSFIRKICEHDARKNVPKYATDLFACSKAAGDYMFGNNSYTVINNAIETDKYVFNESVRKKKREELHLGDKFVIGTVGRLQYQKNPEFIIEIFNAVHSKNPNSELIMVGIGVLEDKIKQMIADYNLTDCVQLLGRRYDVPELMQAFDCFLLPSRFEGLPVVLVEAQTSGLPCYVSDTITQEVNITPLIHFHSIQEDDANLWSESILKTNIQRKNMKPEIIKAGFDIKDLTKKMEDFYLDLGAK